MEEYIDRNSLLRFIGEKPSIAEATEGEMRLIRAVVSTIKNFPAADVNPTVRGRWKPVMVWRDKRGKIQEKDEWYGPLFCCDKCNWTMIGESPYCPHCGAQMGEGGERAKEEE